MNLQMDLNNYPDKLKETYHKFDAEGVLRLFLKAPMLTHTQAISILYLPQVIRQEAQIVYDFVY